MKRLTPTLFALLLTSLCISCGSATETSSSSTILESSSDLSSASSEEISNEQKETITEEDKLLPESVDPDFEYSDLIGVNHKSDVDFSRYRFNNYDDYLINGSRHNYEEYPFVGDPQIYYENGIYYIVGTNDPQCSRTVMYKTEDFASYERVTGFDADFNNPDLWSYGKHAIFAPELYKFGDKYYFYYSDESRITNKRHISVMIADDIDGDFYEYDIESPAFDHTECTITNVANYSVLDQTVFQDDDGELYMFFSSYINGNSDHGQWIYGVKLLSPTEADWSTCTLVCKPGYRNPSSLTVELPWECWPPLNSGGFSVTEGPSMMKLNGKYYLTYSCNHNTQTYYTPCYAVSDSPLGNYEKPVNGRLWSNLLFGCAGNDGRYFPEGIKTYQIWQGYMSGCGHHAITKIEGEYYVCYHNFVNYTDTAKGRCFGLDKLYLDKNGEFVVGAPTRAVQPNFDNISGYSNLALNATFITTEGVSDIEYLNDNRITNFPFDQQSKILKETQIDKEASFEAGKSYLKIKLDKPHVVTGLFIYNSLEYGKAYIDEISFVNFGNGNYLRDLCFDENYIDDDKEFIYPCSAFMVDIQNRVETDTIIIAFDSSRPFKLSEIMVLGE